MGQEVLGQKVGPCQARVTRRRSRFKTEKEGEADISPGDRRSPVVQKKKKYISGGRSDCRHKTTIVSVTAI